MTTPCPASSRRSRARANGDGTVPGVTVLDLDLSAAPAVARQVTSTGTRAQCAAQASPPGPAAWSSLPPSTSSGRSALFLQLLGEHDCGPVVLEGQPMRTPNWNGMLSIDS
ncbi:hypothetical protein GCM10010326_76390 [Streptomyces xanthochromogenes]|uniref:Uncharacterized protein n=1 Tax=Streptomyces xanthochromogenes TaxID=67384 RepID=A0ABQ3AYI9_9ACTN|nr:hypothetical protein GCM10010326_76390 [Streptomyces xanthochromogenes]